MCTTAAPTFAALIADSAICCSMTGTCGLLWVVSPSTVTAHVMNTSQFIGSPYLPDDGSERVELLAR